MPLALSLLKRGNSLSLLDPVTLSEKEARYQQERLRVLQLSALSYGADALWLMLLALDGVLAPHLPIVFALAATVATGSRSL